MPGPYPDFGWFSRGARALPVVAGAILVGGVIGGVSVFAIADAVMSPPSQTAGAVPNKVKESSVQAKADAPQSAPIRTIDAPARNPIPNVPNTAAAPSSAAAANAVAPANPANPVQENSSAPNPATPSPVTASTTPQPSVPAPQPAAPAQTEAQTQATQAPAQPQQSEAQQQAQAQQTPAAQAAGPQTAWPDALSRSHSTPPNQATAQAPQATPAAAPSAPVSEAKEDQARHDGEAHPARADAQSPAVAPREKAASDDSAKTEAPAGTPVKVATKPARTKRRITTNGTQPVASEDAARAVRSRPVYDYYRDEDDHDARADDRAPDDRATNDHADVPPSATQRRGSRSVTTRVIVRRQPQEVDHQEVDRDAEHVVVMPPQPPPPFSLFGGLFGGGRDDDDQ